MPRRSMRSHGPGHARSRRRHRLQLVGGRRQTYEHRASRCWPTTRTSASASPASGTRSGCTAARSARRARSTSAGFSFSGLPGVVIGHNQSIAWGFTNLGPDVSDFYLEQVRGDTYLRDGRYVPLTQRPETIKVAGGGRRTRSPSAAPCTARSSPTRCPSVAEAGEQGARSTGTAQRGRLRGVPRLDRPASRAGRPTPSSGSTRRPDFQQFRAAARDVRGARAEPVYADRRRATSATRRRGRSRSAGPTPPGRRRATGRPPGWRLEWDWKGYVPFEQMPYTYNPPEGFIVAANQAVTASTTPFLTTRVGLRLPQPADPDLLEKRRPRSRPTRCRRSRATPATSSPRRWSRRCST